MSDLDLVFRGVSMMVAQTQVNRGPRGYIHYENGIHVHQIAAPYDVYSTMTAEDRGKMREKNGYGDEWDEDDLHDSYYWDELYPELLREAAVYWVEPDLATVIDHAGYYLPETHLMRPEQVPAPIGVVTFDAPIGERVVDGDHHQGVDVVFWHSCNDGLIVRTLQLDRREHQMLATTGVLPWGRLDPQFPMQAVLVSFWLFIAQKIPRLEQRQAPRQLRRHDLRDAPTLHQATIATLRRREARVGEERPTDVEWTHRWLVSGHWRQQWYPSTGEHHTIWIAPYVKGPDELPLVYKDRAFMVIR